MISIINPAGDSTVSARGPPGSLNRGCEQSRKPSAGAAEAVPTVAYGSHVDKDRLDAARAAGCDEVLPRSRFSSELPAWLRRYLDTAEQV